jgi:hypothetical protein
VPYRERLSPSPWIYLACALIVPACLLVFAPISWLAGIVSAVLLFGGVCALLYFTSPTLTVQNGEFRAGTAHIPLRFTGAATGYRRERATAARGVDLDARAFLRLRGWVDPVVRVDITDPEDPTPYWLVSTRRPEELIAALESARATS